MASTILCVVLLVCALRFGDSQTSCKGRCGIEYYRGYACQCDNTCLAYGECCKDFESKCTTRDSCQGRCGEPFKRGRLCNCDESCVEYNQCCSDYKSLCEAEDPYLTEATEPSFIEGSDPDDSVTPLYDPATYSPDTVTDDVDNPESSPIPESTSGYEPSTATDTPDVIPQTEDDKLFTLEPTREVPTESTDAVDLTGSPQPTAAADLDSSQPTSPSVPELEITTQVEPESVDDVTTVSTLELETSEVTTIPASLMPDSTDTPQETTPNTESFSDDVTTSPTSLTADLEDPSTTVPPPGEELDAASTAAPLSTTAAQDDATSVTEADQPATPVPTSPQISDPPSKPQDKPSTTRPVPAKPGTKPAGTAQTGKPGDQKDYQADDSNDTDLCSGRPVAGVTALRNGTVVVFRGHYFWLLDRNRIPGPARVITEVWGVPSPIDTVFTRCNCQGKTYIFKGSRYWRYDNDVLDSGFPKVIQTGFGGLRGHITAALSVPQYRSRRETVYFFKRGGTVQKYSYQEGTSPTCGQKAKHAVYTIRTRMARQAVSVLEPAISIRTSWRGFPSTITAAVSVPSNREPEGYKYYVFSKSKSYNVRMDSGRPVVPAPKANAPPQATDFIKCPKKN
ncbi:proteoglycan 4b isoform X2 [Mugil cephalus]|uniref:proteoglycan 4b isoform X2 n=1 Tax=Mugil cephalus TaxID=48193 RepID=UPI001FB66632|nr:proteoglycan 4b isoform X2 [Mugil cephalus]